MNIIKSIEHEQLKKKVPTINIGDTVKVHVRVKEGNRERIQVFEGIIIKKQGGGLNETFTVRRLSYGVGVEKTFLLHSPTVEKIEVTRVGKARRAKLFYLRDRLGKSAKTKEKVGAKIETNEITLKEELVEEPEAEELPAEESTDELIAVEEKAKTPSKKEVTEAIEEAEKEVPVESAPEEAPAIETETPVVEETIDTVKEEPVETVGEEPVEDVKEKPVDVAKEEPVEDTKEESVDKKEEE